MRKHDAWLWCDACGSAMSASTTEALWRVACGGATARRLRKRSDETAAEALWREACGSAVARHLLKPCCGETPAEAL